MKRIFLISLSTLAITASSMAGWFFHDDNELKAQLQQEQEHDRLLTGIVLILGVGCVVNLFVGAAIGSKARNAERKEHP